MPKILVTGGAGFIGSHLVQRMLDIGSEVLVVDNMDDYYDPSIKQANLKLFEKEVDFHKCSILDNNALTQLIKKNNVNKIIHLAARPGVGPSLKDPILYSRVNTIGTINLLELAKKNNIEQFIFGSTSSIYGINNVPFKESDETPKQLSPYALSKRSAELYCKFYAENYNVPTTCLRFFTVYGPRQRPEMAIHKFTSLIHQGQPIPMFGDGSTSRDYTFVSDIVDGIVNALFAPFNFEIINLGNSFPTKLSQIIQKIEKVSGKKAIINKMSEQPGDMKKTHADLSKAKKLLNYKPKIGLTEGLTTFNEWFVQNRLPSLTI